MVGEVIGLKRAYLASLFLLGVVCLFIGGKRRG